MFEYDSAPRRSPLFYLGGLLYLSYSFLLPWMVETIGRRFGRAAGALVPGTLLIVLSGALFAIANRRRERLFECQGVVERVEALRPFSDSDEPRETELAQRKLTIRFRAHGDEFRTEAIVYAPWRAGDAIMLLYEAGKAELAMPKEIWREELYTESLNYAIMAILALVGGCFFLWLFY
jgi:hypothetical protein